MMLMKLLMDLLIPKSIGKRNTYQITEVLSERLSLDLKGISFQTITDDPAQGS